MEYDISFGRRLAEIALRESDEHPHAYASRRVTAYLSRLSMEITLKALLERAGVPVGRVKGYSHRLHDLLDAVSQCDVSAEISSGAFHRVPATRIRSADFDFGGYRIAIGDIVDADHPDISQYPNQIRYGATVLDISPALLAAAALRLNQWAVEHWDSICVPAI
jgi:hypothetical protein